MSAVTVTDLTMTLLIPFIGLGITFLVVRLYQTIVKRFRGRVPIGLVASFQQFGSWVIWILGIIVTLSLLLPSVNTTILAVILALGGLAVILAYHGVLAEIVASQFISTYQPVKVGEWIQVGSHYGRVIETDLIETKILTPNSEIVVLPNSILMKEPVVNRTRSGSLRLQIPAYIKRGLDLKEVEDALIQIGQGMKVDLVADSAPEVRVSELSPEYTRVELLLEIANPAKRDLIASEVQKRIYDVLQELERQFLIRADK